MLSNRLLFAAEFNLKLFLKGDLLQQALNVCLREMEIFMLGKGKD